jgi:diadenosine tetraphosphate (Ap4A) HIT family hydrolase
MLADMTGALNVENGGKPCELCESAGGTVLLEAAEYRVVRVADPDFPGFCRVIWKAHVREMTDLPSAAQQRLMGVVFAVEETIRQLFCPDKINLASFGNVVPHLHWHVIPRWREDRNFPEPIWGAVHREGKPAAPVVADEKLAAALKAALAARQD